MFNLKTHFEQVPLEIVRKIVGEQVLRETTAGRPQQIKKEKSNNALAEAEEQFIVLPLASGQVGP
jgi:hypothetical protein